MEMASVCLSRVLRSWPSHGFRLSELCQASQPGFEASLHLQSAWSLLRSLLAVVLLCSFLAGAAGTVVTKNECVLLPSPLLFRGMLA